LERWAEKPTFVVAVRSKLITIKYKR